MGERAVACERAPPTATRCPLYDYSGDRVLAAAKQRLRRHLAAGSLNRADGLEKPAHVALPYALRHSFVSLLFQEGRDFREVA